MHKTTKSSNMYKNNKSFLDRSLTFFQRIPKHMQVILILCVLVLVGLIVTNHVAMTDIISLLLVLKGFFNSDSK